MRYCYLRDAYYLPGRAQRSDGAVDEPGNRSSLMQAWIDDGDTSLPPEKIQVPFMLTPPVAKIGANSGQQVKIMPNKLPTNKESIFYLNVLDIPPNSPEQEGKNALKFAMQNRIKLFYRQRVLLR